jgi:hypothetical protein
MTSSHYASLVTSTLCGFDRLVFRGALQPLVMKDGMFRFLRRAGKRLLDFKEFALATSERVKAAALADVERLGRPTRYLESPRISKEDLARRPLADPPFTKPGLICAFTAVEPCMSFEYHCDADPAKRGLKLRPRKCLHIYKYWRDATFGFMSARLQTWFPFQVQVCLNGREGLAQQLGRRGCVFRRADNCFPWLANPKLAQRMMNEQLRTDWTAALTRVARSLNPLHEEIFAPWPMDYYWSGYQTEWSTDVVFESPQVSRDNYNSPRRRPRRRRAAPSRLSRRVRHRRLPQPRDSRPALPEVRRPLPRRTAPPPARPRHHQEDPEDSPVSTHRPWPIAHRSHPRHPRGSPHAASPRGRMRTFAPRDDFGR